MSVTKRHHAAANAAPAASAATEPVASPPSSPTSQSSLRRIQRATDSNPGNSARAVRARRAAARERLSRAERREEIFGSAFDLLRARDVLPLVLAAGGAEVMVGAEFGAMLGAPMPAASAGFALCGAVIASMLAAGQVGVVMALWSLLKVLSFFNRRMKRPVYYPQERLRRQRLANERRRVRDRFTLNPCPDPEALVAQYARAKGNAREAIRFGSMLCDLEAYCDSSLVRNEDGEIVGRNPGVRGWLRRHCPELAAHYVNAMRYKGLAEKFRQAAGAGDPVPAAPLADPDAKAARALLGGRGLCKITVRSQKVNGVRRGEVVGREFTLDADEVTAAWRRAQDVLATCEGRQSRTRCGSIARLEEALDLRLAPEFAPSGWRMVAVAETGADAVEAPGRRGAISAMGDCRLPLSGDRRPSSGVDCGQQPYGNCGLSPRGNLGHPPCGNCEQSPKRDHGRQPRRIV